MKAIFTYTVALAGSLSLIVFLFTMFFSPMAMAYGLWDINGAMQIMAVSLISAVSSFFTANKMID